MSFFSTRGGSAVTASQAILKGLADDGGLYVPAMFPVISPEKTAAMINLPYARRAEQILKLYLEDFSLPEIRKAVDAAYGGDRFDDPAVAPLKQLDDSTWILELFHGPTLAFKDMALQLLPHLTTLSARKNGENREIAILVATSGDTGKAALEGFRDVPGTSCTVFYPLDGVSDVQRLQMVTTGGNNTHVIAVKGNFDDAQSGVKELFSSTEFAEEMTSMGKVLSSANSINFGRLVPQIVYYFSAYIDLMAQGEVAYGDPVNFCVPTGNFGNILAAYYAKKMGLPVDKLICASNENKVLFDFFKNGVYDRKREFILTSSPSMDILISSNLERLIYHISGNDAKATKKFMEQLSESGEYSITDEMKKNLEDFRGFYASESDTAGKIHNLYEDTGYIIDTHTAVAGSAYDQYCKASGDDKVTVIASTASPFKFAKSVMTAIDEKYKDADDFELIDELAAKGNLEIPDAINDIRNADIKHKTNCSKDEMLSVVREFLN